jgi:putative SOS response-associated peptidase YedK
LIEEYFAAVSDGLECPPRYNIAPTQPVPVVRRKPKTSVRELSLVQWGLIPHWAKDPSVSSKLINARSETISEKPAFRDAFRSRRCLVPVDGFYEWERTSNGKQPYCFQMNDDEMFAFAGIWDHWTDNNARVIETCSILTTTANVTASKVHDRMPVILERRDYDLWLDPEFYNTNELSGLLKPYTDQKMRCYPVSNRVNSPKNDDPECSRLVPLENQAPCFLSECHSCRNRQQLHHQTTDGIGFVVAVGFYQGV